MDLGKTDSVVLLPVHPEYACRILSGEKRVEFRRTRFTAPPTIVVVYATMPVKRLVGAFEVLGIDAASPAALWKKYSSVAGIPRADFAGYFAERDLGFALRIGRVWRFREGVPLGTIASVRSVPQGFKYLEKADLLSLASLASEVTIAEFTERPPN